MQFYLKSCPRVTPNTVGINTMYSLPIVVQFLTTDIKYGSTVYASQITPFKDQPCIRTHHPQWTCVSVWLACIHTCLSHFRIMWCTTITRLSFGMHYVQDRYQSRFLKESRTPCDVTADLSFSLSLSLSLSVLSHDIFTSSVSLRKRLLTPQCVYK